MYYDRSVEKVILMEEVLTEEQHSTFQSMMHAVWSGYPVDVKPSNAHKFLLTNELGKYVGAIAFEPYSISHSINQVYPFHSHSELAEDSVYLIDALYLLPDERNVEEHISKLLFAIVHFGIQNGVKQFVGLPFYELLVAIRVKYRVNIKSLGPILPYQNRYVIPSVLDVSEFMEDHHALYNQAKKKYLRKSEDGYQRPECS
jgi:hypothetical protein